MRQLKISKQITPRDTPSLDKYLQDISKEGLITADEEVKLAERIRDGDEIALQKLVKANLRFVVSVAKQYQGKGMSLPDLINEGNVGLIKAAKRFDEKRGFKFISYAVWWIRQSIISAISEQCRIVQLPLNKVSILNKIRHARSILEQRFERVPETGEISEYLEIPHYIIADTLRASVMEISMDAPLLAGEETNLLDLLHNEQSVNPESGLIQESLREEIVTSLSILSAREVEVVQLYYGINNLKEHGLEEIGIKMGLSSERVRQVKTAAIGKLKKGSRGKILQSFL
jgi:RNA polymerase primary sigma factor